MKTDRFKVKFGKGLLPSRAKLDLYPRFEKFKARRKKIKKKKSQ